MKIKLVLEKVGKDCSGYVQVMCKLALDILKDHRHTMSLLHETVVFNLSISWQWVEE